MAWMYIVTCSDGTFYTGSTALDPEARVWQHNNDPVLSAAYTRKRRPVALAYCEHFQRIDDAFAREKQVQGWSRVKKLALIHGSPDRLVELARSRASPAPGTAKAGCVPRPDLAE